MPEELKQFEVTGNRAFIAELLACFLDDTKERLQLLDQAASAADLPTLVRQFHALKGSAFSIGVSEIATLCHDAEEQARRGIQAEYSAAVASIQEVLSHLEPAMIAYCDSVGQVCESAKRCEALA